MGIVDATLALSFNTGVFGVDILGHKGVILFVPLESKCVYHSSGEITGRVELSAKGCYWRVVIGWIRMVVI